VHIVGHFYYIPIYTWKAYDIWKVKNQSAKSVYCVTLFWQNSFRNVLINWLIRYKFPSYTTTSSYLMIYATRFRCFATSLKVAGSIPDGIIGVFHWHNPSGRTVALRSNQHLTEMSTKNISWGVKTAGALCWPYNLHVPTAQKFLEPQPPATPRACPDF
jgi:hypothetical protein